MAEKAQDGDFELQIVGGGLAGLGTAALLANQGRRVQVLEQRPVLGGRALTVQQKGFTLNYGLHYVVGGPASPHYRILKQIGKVDAAPMAPVDPAKLFRWRYGSLHRVPTTPLDMLSTRLLTPRGKLGLVKAITLLMTVSPEKLWRTPVGEWIDSLTAEASLRTFLLDLGGPLAFEPKPELFSAAHYVLLLRPLLMPQGPLGYYPVGGWNGIFEALKARVEEAGGQVQMKAEVERLEISDGQVVALWVDGERLPCQTVVLAIPPNELAELLRATPVPGLELERLNAIRPTMGVAVDLGVMGLENETIATIELPEMSATLGMHNLFEPSLAPPGGHLIQFLRFLTPEQMADFGRSGAQRRNPVEFPGRHLAGYPGKGRAAPHADPSHDDRRQPPL